MNLKSYAVLRKLTANSEFLNYIMQDKPVPVNMLEKEFHDVLKDMKAENVDLLINDYQKYLRDNVKLGFQQKDNNQFDVNGEIDDPVVETIEILHKVKPEDVVTNLVTSVMSELSPDRELQIDSIKLQESTKQFVEMTEHPSAEFYKNEDTKVSKQEETDDSIEQEEKQESNEEQQVSDEANEIIDNLKAEDVLGQTDDTELIDDKPDESENIEVIEPENESIPDESEYAESEEPEYDFASESLPDTEIEFVEPVMDEDEAQNLKQDAKSAAQAFKDAYDYLIQQIKEKHLDTRLQGLHLPNQI